MKKKVYCKDCYYSCGYILKCSYSIVKTNKYNGEEYYEHYGDISDNEKGKCKNYKEKETK